MMNLGECGVQGKPVIGRGKREPAAALVFPKKAEQQGKGFQWT